MATSTRSKSTRARAGSTGARKPAASKTAATTQATKKYTAKQPLPEREGPGLLTSAWLGMAHVVGGAARLFGKESLAKEERRDGVPFLLVLLAVAGAVVEWFNPTHDVAIALDAYTFGGLFGRVAFALPVIMLIFAVWLFRHPSSVHDNTRIGIGLTLMLTSIAGICHLAGGLPQPSQGMEVLAASGGIIGWVVAQPLASLGVAWLSAIITGLVLALSLFIITKTPPNRIGRRLHELYAYLFGEQLPEPGEKPEKASKAKDDDAPIGEFGAFSDIGLDVEDESTMPWWRRAKPRTDKAFDQVVADEKLTDVVEPLSPPTTVDDDGQGAFGVDLLEELVKAEDAVKRFTGEVETGLTTLRDDAPDPSAAETREAPRVPANAASTPPKRTYRLPAASLLSAGTPPKARTSANSTLR